MKSANVNVKLMKDALVQLNRTLNKIYTVTEQVMIIAHENTLTMYTYNNDFATAISLDADISSSFELCLDCRALKKAVDSAKSDRLTLTSTGEVLAGKVTYKPSSPISVEDMYEMPSHLGLSYTSLNGEALLDAVSKVKCAMHKDNTSEQFHGLLVKGNGNGLDIGATDNHRFHVMNIHASVKCEELINGIVIPFASANTLHALLTKYKPSAIGISVIGESHLRELIVKCDTFEMRIHLPRVNVREYSHIVGHAQRYEHLIELDPRALGTALKSVETWANKEHKKGKFGLVNGEFTIHVEDTNGSANTSVKVQSSTCEGDLVFYANVGYILDVVKQCGDSFIGLGVTDTRSPILIVDRDDTNAVYVVMPMDPKVE